MQHASPIALLSSMYQLAWTMEHMYKGL